jgi:hypothetical protein
MSYIGIDLDNTLINYDTVFPAAANILNISLPPLVQTKKQIREFMRLQPEGEKKWQELQGIAYGKCLKEHAALYPGVKRFFWRCAQNNHKVTVISHKTEYGHVDDEKNPLRKEALSFMKNQCLTSTDNNSLIEIIFKDTRDDKISCISQHDFEWFIDDLPEVVDALDKLNKFKVIYFNPTSDKEIVASNDRVIPLTDWQQIDALINGDWTLEEAKVLIKKIINEEPKTIEKYTSGGNAATYRITMEDDRTLKLKVYPIDSKHDRLVSEFTGSKYMANIKSATICKPIGQDKDLGAGVFEWVEGSSITDSSENEIVLCLDFLKNLNEIREEPQFIDFQLASAACLSGHDIELQINNRLNRFLENNIDSNEMELFLKKKFIPVSETILDWTQQNWPEDIAFNVSVPRSEQILSPSDFGFHNTLRRPDGTLAFLDFEYFGWDDPVKLISDFSFHPGMNLSDKQIIFWINNSLELYGKHLSNRLRVCRPLYGLIWCLILLNDFNPQFWHRRLLANDMKQSSRVETLAGQLSKAEELLDSINTNYTGTYWDIYH